MMLTWEFYILLSLEKIFQRHRNWVQTALYKMPYNLPITGKGERYYGLDV